MAQIFVESEKQFYFAGETVNGSILMNVTTPIMGIQGYECVKWLEAEELRRPVQHPNQPPQPDPIAMIPPHELHNSDNLSISDCQSEDDRSPDHRPKYIKTSQNRYYKMRYYQTKNVFTMNKAMLYSCSNLQPGQYNFPFSFKTFQGWPASFQYNTTRKKGVISYKMTVSIVPMTNQLQVKSVRQVILRQTRVVTAQKRQDTCEVKSCCCFSKGNSSAVFYFEKDGYMPDDLMQVILEVDNTECSANISSISIYVTNVITMRSNNHTTSDSSKVVSKQVNGVYPGQTAKGNNAIRQALKLESKSTIKPSCSGKLLSSQFFLNIRLNHDVSCACCAEKVDSQLPIIIFPYIRPYPMPQLFQNNWAPQKMPIHHMQISNNFTNQNINSLQQQQYIQQQQQQYQQQYQPQQQQPQQPQQQYQTQQPQQQQYQQPQQQQQYQQPQQPQQQYQQQQPQQQQYQQLQQQQYQQPQQQQNSQQNLQYVPEQQYQNNQ